MLNKSKKWCKFNPKHKYDEAAKFSKIIEFYLWKCPVPDTAYGSKTFSEYGWQEPKHFKVLKKKCGLGRNNDIDYITPKRSEFYDTLIHHGQFDSHAFSETVFILNSAQTMSDFFKDIRNAFAHGSFMIRKHPTSKQYYYFLESRNPETKRINARIILKTSTLIAWIRIVVKGPY
jgi:hypothetical protein